MGLTHQEESPSGLEDCLFQPASTWRRGLGGVLNKEGGVEGHALWGRPRGEGASLLASLHMSEIHRYSQDEEKLQDLAIYTLTAAERLFIKFPKGGPSFPGSLCKACPKKGWRRKTHGGPPGPDWTLDTLGAGQVFHIEVQKPIRKSTPSFGSFFSSFLSLWSSLSLCITLGVTRTN